MSSFYNPKPNPVFTTLKQLKDSMQIDNDKGALFVDYLMQGKLKEGKGFWKTSNETSKEIYQSLLKESPHLITEDPFKEKPKQSAKAIVLSNFEQLPKDKKDEINSFLAKGKRRILFAGGPASKIATVIASLNNQHEDCEVVFLIDDASRSNESSSASYAHINHANAFNAEWASSGLGILPTLIKRNLFADYGATQSLDVNYKCVDLWSNNLNSLDFKLFYKNIVHGLVQQIRRMRGKKTEHDKSRTASYQSSLIIDYIEKKTSVNLLLKSKKINAFFINIGSKAHKHSLAENAYLRRSIGLESYKLDQQDLSYFYSDKTAKNITSVDVFPDNSCFTHGFDQKIKSMSKKSEFQYLENKRITEIYLKDGNAFAVSVEDLTDASTQIMAVSSLGLSLGPKVNYRYKNAHKNKGVKGDEYRQGVDATGPIPHQTLATGVSCQVLFKITNKEKYNELPYTGLHQTHFVEMASNDNYVLVKLTSGGNIADRRYSRNYAINALANLLRVITPESGLTFYDVVSAWPCSRGINASNNGQLVRLGDNFVVRFGEGGTGMSKMASNAQVMLDMLQLDHGLDDKLLTTFDDYKHTIVDNRKKTKKALSL